MGVVVEASYDVRIGALLIRTGCPAVYINAGQGSQACGTPQSLDFGYVWLYFETIQKRY